MAELAKTNNAKVGEELDLEIQTINDNMQKLADELGVSLDEIGQNTGNENQNELGENKMTQTPYLNTKKAGSDFYNILENSTKKDVVNNWKENLKKNGVTITDETLRLPKVISEEVQTTLTNTNAVYPLFRVTNMGALIVSSSFESNDEAQVHVEGTEKKSTSSDPYCRFY
ncbi:hypothetical protein [Lactococcus fujiensis]|uniref:hypothetical protein n=1 Tax=Lactococcus fujiensis TaxID=610251 RepID=UPI0006CF7CEA|nr:hypothetical protein [Lactococcus fujiensis]